MTEIVMKDDVITILRFAEQRSVHRVIKNGRNLILTVNKAGTPPAATGA